MSLLWSNCFDWIGLIYVLINRTKHRFTLPIELWTDAETTITPRWHYISSFISFERLCMFVRWETQRVSHLIDVGIYAARDSSNHNKWSNIFRWFGLIHQTCRNFGKFFKRKRSIMRLSFNWMYIIYYYIYSIHFDLPGSVLCVLPVCAFTLQLLENCSRFPISAKTICYNSLVLRNRLSPHSFDSRKMFILDFQNE